MSSRWNCVAIPPESIRAATSRLATVAGASSKRSRGTADITELEVARKAIELAVKTHEPEQKQVAWYLLGEGLERLEQELGARLPWRSWLKRGLRKRATFLYVCGVATIACLFLAVALSLAWQLGVRQPALLLGLGALALFPLSELAIQILNALTISTFEPEPLAKMDFDDGIPAEDLTLVVVPMMLRSLDVVRQELEKLEVRYLANRDANLYFSLFSDFTDATEATVPGDAELLNAIHGGIDALEHPLSRAKVSAVSSPPRLVGDPTVLDRARAQARKNRRAQLLSARQRIRRHPTRRRNPVAGALCHHPRFRHATSSRYGPQHGGHHRPSAESARARSRHQGPAAAATRLSNPA